MSVIFVNNSIKRGIRSCIVYILFLSIVLIGLPLGAQIPWMKIVDEPILLNEKNEIRQDANGRFCAALKIISDMDGFAYDSYNGIVGAIIDSPSEDIVFLSPDERVVLIFHAGYEPLKIILSDFNIELDEKSIWMIEIRGGSTDIYTVSFLISPEGAQIIIDGKAMGRSQTYQLNAGKHSLKIQKDKYKTVVDEIDVDEENVLFRYSLVFNNEMVFIQGGKFEIGDIFNEGDGDEKPVDTVTLESFYLSKFEVTFSEYDAFCEATGKEKPEDSGWGRDLHPVINVNWIDAIQFCNWLSKKENLTPYYWIYLADMSRSSRINASNYDYWPPGIFYDDHSNGYRLPTEAEWEYAAREGGKRVRFGNGKNIADPEEINFEEANRGRTFPVGSFAPNSLGLHEMSGNVCEWCWDEYHTDPFYTDPFTLLSGGGIDLIGRVLKGGAWADSPSGIRIATRWHSNETSYRDSVGFRLCRSYLEAEDNK